MNASSKIRARRDLGPAFFADWRYIVTNRLKDKRALITGGMSGIGLETARRFLAEGARVAITGIIPTTIQAARAELGGDVLVIRADAGDVAGQPAVAEAVHQAFGSLDILFVNAGVIDHRPIEKWDEAGFDRSIAITLKDRSSLFKPCYLS